MLKCSSERWVCAPQSLSAGTSTPPRLSISFRMSLVMLFFPNVVSHAFDLLENHVEPRRKDRAPSALEVDPEPLCSLLCSMRALSAGYKRPALPYDRLCKSALLNAG